MSTQNRNLSHNALENFNNFLDAITRMKEAQKSNDKKHLKKKESLENVIHDMKVEIPPEILEKMLAQMSDELISKANKIFVEAMYDYIDCEEAEEAHREYLASGCKTITHEELVKKYVSAN